MMWPSRLLCHAAKSGVVKLSSVVFVLVDVFLIVIIMDTDTDFLRPLEFPSLFIHLELQLLMSNMRLAFTFVQKLPIVNHSFSSGTHGRIERAAEKPSGGVTGRWTEERSDREENGTTVRPAVTRRRRAIMPEAEVRFSVSSVVLGRAELSPPPAETNAITSVSRPVAWPLPSPQGSVEFSTGKVSVYSPVAVRLETFITFPRFNSTSTLLGHMTTLVIFCVFPKHSFGLLYDTASAFVALGTRNLLNLSEPVGCSAETPLFAKAARLKGGAVMRPAIWW